MVKEKGELWTVEPKMVKVADLIPYENNVRDNNEEAVEAVVESIKRHGYQERILIDENNVIIRGHTRLKAFKRLGWEEVEALVTKGWTEEQKKIARVADNRTQELSMPKPKEMDLELREFADLDYAKKMGFAEVKQFATGTFGITQAEIDKVGAELESSFEDKEVAKHDGMVKLPCPHCDHVFMMRLKDLQSKVKIVLRDKQYE